MIERIEIVRRSKVRRAKLYYIREKVAREIRRHMRNVVAVGASSTADFEQKPEPEMKEEDGTDSVSAEENDGNAIDEIEETKISDDTAREGDIAIKEESKNEETKKD